MLDLWIIYDRTRYTVNRWFASRLVEVFKNKGLSTGLLIADTPEEIPNRCFPKIVLNRTGSAIIADSLEKEGCRVWNNADVARIGNDKWEAYRRLEEAGIGSLPSYLAASENLRDLPDIFPAVLKSRDGHGGTEVYFVSNQNELIEAFRKIGKPTAVFQRAAADLGKDLRVYVLGKKIVAGILRSSKTDFRSNFCLGGTAEIADPIPPEIIDQVRRITDIYDFGLAGIDFVFDRGKPVFNEIEDVVGTRTLYAKTDLDIAELYADFILKAER